MPPTVVIDSNVRAAYQPMIPDVLKTLADKCLPPTPECVDAFWLVVKSFRPQLGQLCKQFGMSRGACAVNALLLAQEYEKTHKAA